MKCRFGIILFILLIASFANAQQVATPTFTPDGGSYFSWQYVTVRCSTIGAVIHYTTNGSTPEESSPVIGSGYSVNMDRSYTLKARAFMPGMLPSEVKSAEYTITMYTPTFSPIGGLYAEPQRVKITSTSGSTIFYTLDGSDPHPPGPSILSGGKVLIDHSCTLKAVGYKPGCELSAVRSAVYSFREPAIQHVRIDGSNSNDGLTWDAAKRTIQAAIYAARPGDEVWVAGGTYGTVRITDGIKLCGGFAGNETERTQRNVKANETIIDGDGGGYVVWCMYGAGSTTTIDGFTIQHGTAAIDGYGASPTIRNNVITDNHGAVCIELSGGPEPFIMANNLIIGNNAGGIYCFLNSSESGSSIVNNTFANNSGTAISFGGARRIVKNNIVAFNTYGMNVADSGGVPLTDRNCVFGNGRDYVLPYLHPTDINADPLFRDIANGDYRLSMDSPCIDAGTNEFAPATDIEGSVRPMDGNHDGLAVTDIGAYESPMPVQIDILHDTIRLQPNKLIQVAILSDPVFNALNVDPKTAAFGPGSAKEIHGQGHREDVNGDGLTDLLFHFSCTDVGLMPGYQTLTLTGKLMTGEDIIGSDGLTGIMK